MRQLNTQIEIAASAARIWKKLMDFGSYGEWNPFVRSIEGEAVVGGSLSVYIQPEGGRGMKLSPMVVAVEPERKFAWKGSLLFAGIFDGMHEFRIEPKDNGSSTFIQREEFTGITVPLLWPILEKDTRRGFDEMNKALKKLAETE